MRQLEYAWINYLFALREYFCDFDTQHTRIKLDFLISKNNEIFEQIFSEI